MECDNSDSEPQETDTITDPKQTFSDMKICFSTVAGYSSFRDAKTGSWYVDVMSKVFWKYSSKMHLDNMLKIIAEQMQKYVGEKIKCKLLALKILVLAKNFTSIQDFMNVK